MLKLLGSNLALFLGLSLVTFVEMDDHSQVHDWRYYGFLTAFILSVLAFAVNLFNMARSKS